MSVGSAACVLWLEQYQPLFATLALMALGYQTWLVLSRPAHKRTSMMLAILWTSLATSLVVAGALLVLSLRYW